MAMIHLLLALVVGISETCATNGNVVAQGAYAEAVRKAGDIPVVICRTAKPEDLDRIVEGLDLLIATGGEDVDPARYGEEPSPHLGRVNAVRDEFEDRLFAAAVRHELPIIGTCRGVQHMNVFFGGTLHQDLPSDLGSRYTVEHRTGRDSSAARRDRRHPIEIVPESRLARACGTDRAVVNSLHHQAVKGLAPGMTVTAWTPDGVVEAIECAWYPAAGIQFHPESVLTKEGKTILISTHDLEISFQLADRLWLLDGGNPNDDSARLIEGTPQELAGNGQLATLAAGLDFDLHNLRFKL